MTSVQQRFDGTMRDAEAAREYIERRESSQTMPNNPLWVLAFCFVIVVVFTALMAYAGYQSSGTERHVGFCLSLLGGVATCILARRL